MNRELKFRVWDKQYQKFHYPSQIHLSPTISCFVEKPNKDGTYILVDGENAEFQEFTGLRDTTGKDIYEGDLLKEYENKDFVSSVFFRNGSFCTNLSTGGYLEISQNLFFPTMSIAGNSLDKNSLN